MLEMVAFSVVPLLALLGGAVYASVVTYQLGDWRPSLFIAMLILMSIHQSNELLVFLDHGPARALSGFGEYPETIANLLASVERILRRHGGEVWAEGTVGEGATIYFRLSSAPASENGSVSAE